MKARNLRRNAARLSQALKRGRQILDIFTGPAEPQSVDDWDSMSFNELRRAAKLMGISSHRKTRDQLVRALKRA